jgi:alkylhydroperoxidase family enzyme
MLAEAHLLFTQFATGKAFTDGLAAAHLSMQALSLHPHAKAQLWEAAQASAAKQASISDAHLSKLQVHCSSQVAVLQSISVAVYSFLATEYFLPAV